MRIAASGRYAGEAESVMRRHRYYWRASRTFSLDRHGDHGLGWLDIRPWTASVQVCPEQK